MPNGNSNNRLAALSYRSILVIANVTERVTGKTLSGNSTVRCYSKQYDFEFLDMTPTSFKPGLQFTGYVSPYSSPLLFAILVYLHCIGSKLSLSHFQSGDESLS